MKIIVDTREKLPWKFSGYDVELVTQKLDEGDYTSQAILDKEQETGRKILRIERKRRPTEIAGNLSKKVNLERFRREMARLQEYEFKYLILEFPAQELIKYPFVKGIKFSIAKKMKIRGKYLMMLLNKIQEEFGIEIIFCNDIHEAQRTAMEILKEVSDAD